MKLFLFPCFFQLLDQVYPPFRRSVYVPRFLPFLLFLLFLRKTKVIVLPFCGKKYFIAKCTPLAWRRGLFTKKVQKVSRIVLRRDHFKVYFSGDPFCAPPSKNEKNAIFRESANNNDSIVTQFICSRESFPNSGNFPEFGEIRKLSRASLNSGKFPELGKLSREQMN